MSKKKKKKRKWKFEMLLWPDKKGGWKVKLRYSKKMEPTGNSEFLEAKGLFEQFFMTQWTSDEESGDYKH